MKMYLYTAFDFSKVILTEYHFIMVVFLGGSIAGL
jgi:hypothetical protein